MRIITHDLIETLTDEVRIALGDLLDNGPNEYDDQRVKTLIGNLCAVHESLRITKDGSSACGA